MLRTKQLRSGDLRSRCAPRARFSRPSTRTERVEGIPFMPEMVQYVDKQLPRVESASRRSAGRRAESCSRRLPNTVLLEDLRCDGARTAAARPSAGSTGRTPGCEQVYEGGADTGKRSPTTLEALARPGHPGDTDDERPATRAPEEVFRCQITESVRASTPVAAARVGISTPPNCGTAMSASSPFLRVVVAHEHLADRAAASVDDPDMPRAGRAESGRR